MPLLVLEVNPNYVQSKASSSFCDWAAAAKGPSSLERKRINAANSILSDEIQAQSGGLLLQELHHRLHRDPGPRLLIDGCWFSRPYGGVTRVWQQIFSTWQLPGLINSEAPVALINRNSRSQSQLRYLILGGARSRSS